MDKYRTSLLFQCLIFLIPLNFYMWGDWFLVNFQWALFRFQQSSMGDSLIRSDKDILYIYLGQNTGIFNIAAAGLWTIGAILLLLGFIITIYATYVRNEIPLLRKVSLLIIAGAILFVLSAACRFQGGFAIPVGVPIILIIGWWMYQENRNEEGNETESGVDSEKISGS